MSGVPRLTWHAGSVLPFASLWHTVHRVAAINSMRAKELPFALDLGGRGPLARRADLLFNEPRFCGERTPGEALSVDALAASLGEPVEAFAWSHFGHPDHDGQRHQRVQLVHGLGQAHPGHERGLLVDHHVHGHADQQFGQDVEDLVEHRIDRAQHGVAAKRAGKLGEAAQRINQKLFKPNKGSSGFEVRPSKAASASTPA